MRADDECLCGHVRDEHEVSGPCQVDDCRCKRFNLSDWQGDDPE